MGQLPCMARNGLYGASDAYHFRHLADSHERAIEQLLLSEIGKSYEDVFHLD